jgi:hypothetical protein
MAKRNAGRRGRPRKRRSGSAGATAATDTGTSAVAERPPAQARPSRARGTDRGGSGRARPGYRDPGGLGERPEAPWHPWPLSELLIFVGAIGTLLGVAKQESRLLYAGLGAVVLGTLEFTIREHRSGYRSHSSLLAAVPTALVHGALAFGLFALGGHGTVLVLAPVAIDLPVFWLLFRYWRGRFEDARRERVFALGGRR